MSRQKAIIFGAGGHAKVMLEVILENDLIDVIGLLDPSRTKWGQRLLGVEVLGGDDLVAELKSSGVSGFYIGLGSAGNLAPRKMLFQNAVRFGLKPLSALHQNATISKHAQIRPGVCVMAGAVVNPGARIGANVCVNTAAVIEHDCLLGTHCFIGPGVRLGGAVVVGSSAFVGIGATVRHAIRIGTGALVGAGAVVVKNVLPKQTVVGVPARALKT